MIRSAPQKQPIPTVSTCVPVGQGPANGVPSTSWVAGTTKLGWERPGSASAAHLDQIYSNYVMDSQRTTHNTVTRGDSAGSSGGPKVELF